MKKVSRQAEVFGEMCEVELAYFDDSDRVLWKELFDKWADLKKGMKRFEAREPNILEGISEVAFCIWSGSGRLLNLKGNGSSSFDTYNEKTKRAEQIKAASVIPDLTSFGPRSKWDDLYFIDFYNIGKLDGTFNVFKIPSKLIYETMVNRDHTFRQQQALGRRPRFSIYDKIIVEKSLKPVGEDIKIW
jgi:hypothetical protein